MIKSTKLHNTSSPPFVSGYDSYVLSYYLTIFTLIDKIHRNIQVSISIPNLISVSAIIITYAL